MKILITSNLRLGPGNEITSNMEDPFGHGGSLQIWRAASDMITSDIEDHLRYGGSLQI